MSIDSLNTDIALARHEFDQFRASAVAEQLVRLYRFRSMLFAREYALDRHDWRGPEDFVDSECEACET